MNATLIASDVDLRLGGAEILRGAELTVSAAPGAGCTWRMTLG